ncbi:MAG TPA: hypothetical protein VG652_12685 [Gaiellaceae bacterium]|nr:hypothetical protein [Gaiellaceae bacterium]
MLRLLVLATSFATFGALFSGAGTAATQPTPASCVVAWDQGAPTYVVHQILVGNARLAFVAPAIEHDGVPLARASCTFSFALRHGRMLSLSGGNHGWSRPSLIALPLSVGPNAVVNRDGTLALRR